LAHNFQFEQLLDATEPWASQSLTNDEWRSWLLFGSEFSTVNFYCPYLLINKSTGH
jgi:hypothetical protein